MERSLGWKGFGSRSSPHVLLHSPKVRVGGLPTSETSPFLDEEPTPRVVLVEVYGVKIGECLLLHGQQWLADTKTSSKLVNPGVKRVYILPRLFPRRNVRLCYVGPFVLVPGTSVLPLGTSGGLR